MGNLSYLTELELVAGVALSVFFGCLSSLVSLGVGWLLGWAAWAVRNRILEREEWEE